MQAEHMMRDNRIADYLAKMVERYPKMLKFAYPSQKQDYLFRAEYDHPELNASCEACDSTQRVDREPRTHNLPVIHYGVIASGNQVMKHGKTRDRIAQEDGILCFEMEAAGLMNNFPCFAIHGIRDYVDSHKNKDWQQYFAATAAAYAKEFLSVTPVRQVEITPKAIEVE